MFQVSIGPEDAEHLAMVLEKAAAIAVTSNLDEPTDEQIRRLSADLRFMLVDGHLQRAWKMVGFPKEPTISVPAFLAKDDASGATIVLGGGARVGGMMTGAVRYHNRAMSDEEMKASYEKEKDTMNAAPVQVGLRAFLDSRKVIVAGKAMTRRQVIKYVANKLGGVHFEHKEREPAVEAVRGSIRIFGKDPVLLEVLAYGQQLSDSPDIGNLISRIHQVLGR